MIYKEMAIKSAVNACNRKNNCDECVCDYEKETPCNVIRAIYKESIWNYK